METREEVMGKAAQIVDVLKDCNEAEVLTVIITVLNKMNLPYLPIQIVGNMARVMHSNEVVISEQGPGWDVAFKVKTDNKVKEPDFEDELDAEIFHEDDEDHALITLDDEQIEKIKNDPRWPEGSLSRMEQMESESIRRALVRNQGSRKRAAEDLQISERTLYRKMEKYGIKS